jgi:hypothetical protein
MTTKTLYVSRKLLNGNDMVKWAREQGFVACLQPNDFHVTIAYSKTPVEYDVLKPNDKKLVIHASPNRDVIQLGDKGARVLRFNSKHLTDRWNYYKDMGAEWSFPDYHPHVTISYTNLRSSNYLANVVPYTGELIFGKEIITEIDENFTDKIAELRLD